MEREANLIVGLGKPGRKDAKTHGNAGFIVVDHAVRKAVNTFPRFAMTDWKTTRKYMVMSLQVEPLTLIVKPRTYEQHTPGVVKKLIDFYKIDPSNLAFIYPEKKVEFGKYKIDKVDNTSPWIKNIAETIKLEGFLRLKIGTQGKGEGEEVSEIDWAVYEKVGENLLRDGFGLSSL